MIIRCNLDNLQNKLTVPLDVMYRYDREIGIGGFDNKPASILTTNC